MPVIDDFTDVPESQGEGDDAFAVEQDLLDMPALPWTAIITTFFAVVMCFGLAHTVLLAFKEKNKLISQTLELRGNLKQKGVAVAAIPNEDDVVLIPEGPR